MKRNPSEPRAAQPGLGPEDARWVARLAEVYQPEPQTALERQALEARVREGIGRRSARARWGVGGLAAGAIAAFAALAVWLALPADRVLPPAADPVARAPARVVAATRARPDPASPSFEERARAAFEERLFYSDGASPSLAEEGEAAWMPAEYVAIEAVFFE